MSTRAKIPLSDFITLQRGFDLPTARRKEGDVPVIASTGIAGYHKEAKVRGPGVVIGRSGSIGGGQYTADDFWPLNTTLWVKDFKGNNPRFTFYLLKGIDFTRFNAGAGVPTLNRNHIASLRVSTFSSAEQDQIADILSAYDDLIENNRRRIQLLEESARLLYREWFVHLRFPGHEHAKIIDGVPEGWEKKRLIDIVELIMGQSPKSKFYNDKGEGLPFHQGVTNFGERFVEHKTYCTAKNRIAEKSDILCSVRAPVGRLNITLNRIIIGRGISSIRSKSDHQSFLYYNLKEHFFKEDMIGGGAIFVAATKKDMGNQELLCPLAGVIEKFEYISNPIDEQIKVLHNQNIRLKKARDLLLPRLMNGEIAV